MNNHHLFKQCLLALGIQYLFVKTASFYFPKFILLYIFKEWQFVGWENQGSETLDNLFESLYKILVLARQERREALPMTLFNFKWMRTVQGQQSDK